MTMGPRRVELGKAGERRAPDAGAPGLTRLGLGRRAGALHVRTPALHATRDMSSADHVSLYPGRLSARITHKSHSTPEAPKQASRTSLIRPRRMCLSAQP
ncbi:hypothetical protein PMIN07_004771 [Paraphaeosphaeria minitans]